MTVHVAGQFESAFQNPMIALVIGAAVSLDVVALTFSSPNIFNSDWRTWSRWAKYNAGWHAGLLLFYLFLIDVGSVAVQYIGFAMSIRLPEFLQVLQPLLDWIAHSFRSHIVIYASMGAMGYVWWQYSTKVLGVPTKPLVEQAPIFLRWLFRKKAGQLADHQSTWFWHLSACLVAVDMLALAAVIKSGEKLVQFPQGFDRFEGRLDDLHEKIIASFNWEFFFTTTTIAAAVFATVWVCCFLSSYVSNGFWKSAGTTTESRQTSIVVVFLLKLLEPLIIFYFIIHSMAFLATGVPLHSPAFLLGSAFLVAALIQYVGLANIVGSASKQVSAAKRKG
jgi:hypothetical protein